MKEREEKMKKICIMILLCICSLSSWSQEQNRTNIIQAKDFTSVSKNKKQVFIDTLVPIINQIKEEIKNDKERVETLLEKEEAVWTKEDRKILEENYEKYKVGTKTPEELLKKMVLPPTSLILAQASVESGWGSSGLAKLGNNLFGMTSSSKSPKDSVQVGKMRYKKYENIYASVEDYILTISRHTAYKNLRGGIRRGEDSVSLVKHLGAYSELGKTYGNYVANIITKNALQKHDRDF